MDRPVDPRDDLPANTRGDWPFETEATTDEDRRRWGEGRWGTLAFHAGYADFIEMCGLGYRVGNYLDFIGKPVKVLCSSQGPVLGVKGVLKGTQTQAIIVANATVQTTSGEVRTHAVSVPWHNISGFHIDEPADFDETEP